MLILQLAASRQDWFIVTADVTGAFLQGDQALAKRQEPLFIRQPKEGLPDLQPGQLLLVVRGIFGLANSLQSTVRLLPERTPDPRHRRPCRRPHLHGKPGAAADAVLDRVRAELDFGDWHDSRKLVYGGKEIAKNSDGAVTISQESFIRALTLTPVPPWRTLMKEADAFIG